MQRSVRILLECILIQTFVHSQGKGTHEITFMYYETCEGLSGTNFNVCTYKPLNSNWVLKFHVQNGISIVPY